MHCHKPTFYVKIMLRKLYITHKETSPYMEESYHLIEKFANQMY